MMAEECRRLFDLLPDESLRQVAGAEAGRVYRPGGRRSARLRAEHRRASAAGPSDPIGPRKDDHELRSRHPIATRRLRNNSIKINRICDRFEAAWRAGRRPAAEDHLGDAVGPERSALLRELIATELECRRAIGERVARAEYRARFPDDDDAPAIEAAFVRAGNPSNPAGFQFGRRAEPAFRPPGVAERLHRPRRPAGRVQRLGRSISHGPSGRSCSRRGAIDARRPRPAGGPRRRAPQAARGRPRAEPGLSQPSGGSTRDSLEAGRATPTSQASPGAASARSRPPPATPRPCMPSAPRPTTAGGSAVLRPHARGGLGAGLRGPGRGAEPRGRPQGDPRTATPTTRSAGRGSSSRPRSPAGWSIRGSCRSTAWAHYADGRPFYAMRFIQGDSLKEAIAALPRRPAAARPTPASRSLALRSLLRRFLDVCNAIAYAAQPGGAPPRPQAGQHHARPVRRDPGRRLGPGQGRGPAARPASPPDERTLRPESGQRHGRDAAPARRSGRRPT